jgi:hypothetical protein
MAFQKFKYEGVTMGRVKSNLPSLVLSKRPRFRPRKIVFPAGRNSFFKLKGSYVETSLNA